MAEATGALIARHELHRPLRDLTDAELDSLRALRMAEVLDPLSLTTGVQTIIDLAALEVADRQRDLVHRAYDLLFRLREAGRLTVEDMGDALAYTHESWRDPCRSDRPAKTGTSVAAARRDELFASLETLAHSHPRLRSGASQEINRISNDVAEMITELAEQAVKSSRTVSS